MVIHYDMVSMFKSPCLWAATLGWGLAQLIKMLLGFSRTHQFDFRYFLSTGGMPSAHSALVCALSTSIGMTQGFDSPISVLSFFFAAVTMFDAASVRRAAGHQAIVLNQMIQELFKERRLSQMHHLKELLGHTRKEVFAGMLLGIVVAVLVVQNW